MLECEGGLREAGVQEGRCLTGAHAHHAQRSTEPRAAEAHMHGTHMHVTHSAARGRGALASRTETLQTGPVDPLFHTLQWREAAYSGDVGGLPQRRAGATREQDTLERDDRGARGIHHRRPPGRLLLGRRHQLELRVDDVERPGRRDRRRAPRVKVPDERVLDVHAPGRVGDVERAARAEVALERRGGEPELRVGCADVDERGDTVGHDGAAVRRCAVDAEEDVVDDELLGLLVEAEEVAGGEDVALRAALLLRERRTGAHDWKGRRR